MIRKSFRRRPELETMESKLLLSGVTQTHFSPAAALTAPIEKVPAVQLVGTAKGTFHEVAKGSLVYDYSAHGSLSPVGKSTVKGTTDYGTGTGTVTVSTKHGKINADVTLRDLGASADYTITGGTGQYSGATGSGVADLTNAFSKGKGPLHGKITITFVIPD
jgi:hypothetical protein